MLIGKICKFTEVYGESHSCLNYRWESGVCSFAFLIAYATDTNTFHYFALFNQSAMPNPRAVRFSPPHCGAPSRINPRMNRATRTSYCAVPRHTPLLVRLISIVSSLPLHTLHMHLCTFCARVTTKFLGKCIFMFMFKKQPRSAGTDGSQRSGFELSFCHFLLGSYGQSTWHRARHITIKLLKTISMPSFKSHRNTSTFKKNVCELLGQ